MRRSVWLGTGRLARFCSTKAEWAHKERFSEFVYQSLYDKQRGYFRNPEHIQLGRLDQSIDFGRLWGYDGYIQELSSRYPKNHFLTPSEIFRPYYGMTTARVLVQRAETLGLSRLAVVEIGSGLGGHADALLSYLKNYRPELYASISYTLVEISESLLSGCRKVLAENHASLIQKGGVRFVNQDGLKFEGGSSEPTFVLMFELLDNLSHDKVTFGPTMADPEESWVLSSADRVVKQEIYLPLSEPNTTELLTVWKDLYFCNGRVSYKEDRPARLWPSPTQLLSLFRSKRNKKFAVYLPTGFYRLIKHLRSRYPRSEFVLSDFSSLPANPSPPGITEIYRPIVSRKLERSEEAKDFSSALEAPFGEVDIFFPSDFELIKRITESVAGGAYQVLPPREYFKRFAAPNWARTASTFNPMHEDFANTRFLLPK